MNGDALAVSPVRDPADGSAARSRFARLARPAALLLLVFTAAGLVSASQIYVSYSLGTSPMSFVDAAIWQMPPWYVWGLFTPFIFYLARRFPLERGAWPRSVAVHLLANTLLAFPHLTSSVFTGKLIGLTWYLDMPVREIVWKLFAKNAHMEVLTYWGIVASSHALAYRKAWQERALAAAQLETRLATAQLEALRMQLHPHFLFNTLNAISMLVRKQETQTAVKMLAGLSDLLRIALDSTGRQVVPLQQELGFLERYLAIERLRFQDRLTVDVSAAPETLDAEVPNLILQPIVENALRHGLAPRVEPGRVAVACKKLGERLHITVTDDGQGLREGWSPGLGLSNVRARLEQLYPNAHHLSLDPAPGGGVVVTLELPFRHG